MQQMATGVLVYKSHVVISPVFPSYVYWTTHGYFLREIIPLCAEIPLPTQLVSWFISKNPTETLAFQLDCSWHPGEVPQITHRETCRKCGANNNPISPSLSNMLDFLATIFEDENIAPFFHLFSAQLMDLTGVAILWFVNCKGHLRLSSLN